MKDLLTKLRILSVILWDGIFGSFQYWKTEVYDRDLDERYCCDGRMCGCGAETIREQWSKHSKITLDFPEGEIKF